jgi:hypothetical protein
MNECKKCSIELDKQRAHLGYTECLECSEVEAYSAHTVYPHKTGGYVQPVSKTASNNLKRVGGNWDKWLEQYYHNLYNPKPKKVIKDIPKPVNHISYDRLFNKAVLHYKENGYQNTVKYLKELYSKDRISMSSKSKIIDELNGWEVLPKRMRKWVMKIK